jgi:hypothetical protein
MAAGAAITCAGEPVQCGAGLCVLTNNGWMAGRYERSGDHATFWFTLPGVAEECVIRIRPDMLFAWPSELTPGRRRGPVERAS